MNKFVKYALMSLAIAMMFVATDAFASSGGGLFTTIASRMITTFKNSRSVIFIVGGFGLIGLGFAAIFGKVNWKWLAALACGLAIVAVAGQVVDYTTRAGTSQHYQKVSGSAYVDTLTGNSGAGYWSGTEGSTVLN